MFLNLNCVFYHVNSLLCSQLNPLNTQLNSICHLLALLGAHRTLYISRISVNYLQGTVLYYSKVVQFMRNISHGTVEGFALLDCYTVYVGRW
jgi:hypothetical protein